jgi:hypothetical protein
VWALVLPFSGRWQHVLGRLPRALSRPRHPAPTKLSTSGKGPRTQTACTRPTLRRWNAIVRFMRSVGARADPFVGLRSLPFGESFWLGDVGPAVAMTETRPSAGAASDS